ncbi:hypothetical protein ACGY1D_31315, partial [Burkholderia pseudomallei]|uniref:hypothetical protein n=2 Tax=Burkholderia pseudomallei TaxID=28450 RepID=UPI001C4B808E
HAQMRVAPRAAARQHEADRRLASFTVGKFANPIGFDRGDIGRKPLPNVGVSSRTREELRSANHDKRNYRGGDTKIIPTRQRE